MICTKTDCRKSESVQKIIRNPGLFAHTLPSAHINTFCTLFKVCRSFSKCADDLHTIFDLHTLKCAEALEVCRSFSKCADDLHTIFDLHTLKCAEALEVCRSFSKCAEDFVSRRRVWPGC